MNKLLIATGITVASVIGLGGTIVSAQQGEPNNRPQTSMRQMKGHQKSLEFRAGVLGMSTDELQKALQNKTMSQLAVERGMNEETFRAKMTEASRAHWESMGLSQEEINQRIADREARHAANSADHEFGSGEGMHRGGFGRQR